MIKGHTELAGGVTLNCSLRHSGALGGVGGKAVASRVANLATWSVALLERGPVLSLRVQFFVELLAFRYMARAFCSRQLAPLLRCLDDLARLVVGHLRRPDAGGKNVAGFAIRTLC